MISSNKQITHLTNLFIPEISVVIPVFNEHPLRLKQCFDSLVKQTLSNYECLIVDESSDIESTNECIRLSKNDARFKYIRPSRFLGLAGSLNLGIIRSKSELIARFDSDDICHPKRLELQKKFMDCHLNIAVLGGAVQVIDGSGNFIYKRSYPAAHDDIARGMHFRATLAHSAVMIRKESISRVGLYNIRYSKSEDLDLWLRMMNCGCRFANLNDVVISFRCKSVIRPRSHWRANLGTRLNNFKKDQALIRVLGILLIGGWLFLPVFVQKISMKFYSNLFMKSEKDEKFK